MLPAPDAFTEISSDVNVFGHATTVPHTSGALRGLVCWLGADDRCTACQQNVLRGEHRQKSTSCETCWCMTTTDIPEPRFVTSRDRTAIAYEDFGAG
jgi:hypothetical protein